MRKELGDLKLQAKRMELISVTKDLDTSENELGDWVSVWRDDLAP